MRVLGPLEIRANGVALPLGTRKQQTVLAILAVQSGRVVGIEELIDELWPVDPPASAVPNARTYAASLRRLFDAAEPTRGLIRKQSDGYLLRANRSDIDLHAFLDECQRARELRADADSAKAAEVLASALARWRGPMLAGLAHGSILAARCAALEEERLAATEELADLHLELGRPADAVRLIRDHTQRYPLRERAHGLLMQARAAAGDVAGALSAYVAARRALAEELGIEPGPELRELHRALLDRGSVRNPGAQRPASPSACWLPRRTADFTGRTDLTARLVADAGAVSPAPPVHLIDGMAGSGKTTLAVEVAYRLAADHPDAQLFIDLQGHSEAGALDPGTALVTLLRQLGLPAGRIPADLEGRVALWRAELAHRRAVVVLDNAAGSDQVSQLLPVSPRVAVLVTSRRRLAAMDGARTWPLSVMSPDEAVELLRRVAGAERVATDPEAADEVVRRCGYLPLAVRLAGARLVHRPGWRLADLAHQLRYDAALLPELAVEDRSIVGTLALSYEPLADPARRLFRLLGLWEGDHLGLETAAALSGLPLAEAGNALRELVDRHLMEETGVGRFRLHDLVREYANSLTLENDSSADRWTAIERVLDHYLHVVAEATYPIELRAERAHVALADPVRPDLLAALHGAGLGWLELERANIRALVRCAHRSGHLDYAWRLARLAWRFYFVRGYYDDIMDTHRHGLAAAEKSGDHAAAGMMHNYLASAFVRVSRYEEALGHLDKAIELRKRGQDRIGAWVSEANIAVVYHWTGRFEEAVAIAREALVAWRGSADDSISSAFSNMTLPLIVLGRHAEALRLSRMHLMMACEQQDSVQIANALHNVGQVRLRMGEHGPAARIIRSAIALKRRTGYRYGENEALNDLATAYRLAGRLDDAERHHRAALDAAEEAGEGHAVAAALNGLGLTLVTIGRRNEAVALHRRALALATRINHPYEQARALAAIAHWAERDDPAAVRPYRLRALTLFRRMNVPEQFEIERRLAESATSDRP